MMDRPIAVLNWRVRVGSGVVALLLAACSTALQTGTGPGGVAPICATGASAVNPQSVASGGVGMLANEGLGGTGKPASEGLGGTGLTAGAPSGGGIGGTGRPQVAAGAPGGGDGIGGTGIVGVVTGFASICVNGIELHYQDNTPVLEGQRGSSLAALQVGQVVAVRANRTTEMQEGTQLQAQRIVVLHAAVGPLTRLDSTSGRFAVMGQEAQALAPQDLSGLSVGDWVRVSGHRTPTGEIRASRVQAIAKDSDIAQVLGPVTFNQGRQGRVGATPTVWSGSANDVVLGREVLVTGRWDGTQLLAQQVTANPTRASLGSVGAVLLQGYVHAVQGNELQLGYESLQLPSSGPASANQLQVGQRVQVRARADANQRLTVEQWRISGESGSRGSNTASEDDSGRGRGRGRGGSGSSLGSGDDGSSGQGRGRGRSGGDSGTSGGSTSGSSSGSGSSGGSGGSSNSGSGGSKK